MNPFPSLENIKEDTELKGKINAKFSTIEYQFDTVLKNVENNTWNDAVITQDIINNYDKYLDYGYFLDPITRQIFQKLWTNNKWLKCLYNAFRQIDNIKLNQYSREYYKIVICKIAYDYCNDVDKDYQNQETIDLLYRLAEYVNHKLLIVLSPIIYPKDALNICIARYSDTDNSISIKRLNHVLMNLKYDLDRQKISTIYYIFFSDTFSSLFRYTMTDLYCPNSEFGKAIYNRINVVLLEILNSMGRPDILNTLKSYSEYTSLLNIKDVRFSLHTETIQKIYPAINNALHTLADDKYFVI